MELKFKYIIPIWYIGLIIVAWAFSETIYLPKTYKNVFIIYCLLIAITGLFADNIVVANKPFEDVTLIQKRYPELWDTNVNLLNFLDLGPTIQGAWDLYIFGNINYQNSKHWTWNFEIPHIMGNTIYLLAILFLCLKDHNAFLISLLFGSIILSIDYFVYILSLIQDHMNGIHTNTPLKYKLISWGFLDFPYMFLAGFSVLWYSYTELTK
jgi:hypothetical protein